MLAVHGGCGADFRLGELHGLALVLDISVAGNLGIALKQVLEYNNGFARQGTGVKGETKLNRTALGFWRELFLCRDLLAIDFQWFHTFFIHKNAR